MSSRPGNAHSALIGGLVIGVLSALPLISAVNLCCCLWVVSGGAVAAYLQQEHQTTPLTAADGAMVGLMAGVVGAFIYLVLSIPVNILVAPMERAVLQRLAETAGTMPPEFRTYLNGYVGGVIGAALGFVFMLFVGSIFATLGGLLGVALFRTGPPAVTHEVPEPPS